MVRIRDSFEGNVLLSRGGAHREPLSPFSFQPLFFLMFAGFLFFESVLAMSIVIKQLCLFQLLNNI
jgi:hypothetical protein